MENFDTTICIKAINIIKEESQFDRIEKKMDRILEFLESKDSSTSFVSVLGKTKVEHTADKITTSVR